MSRLCTHHLGRLVVVGVTAGCGATAPEDWQRQGASVIYQQDDRVEARQYPDPVLRELALDVVGAIIPRAFLVPGNGGYEFDGPTLASRRALCSGEAMSDQPSVAVCTAILAGEDTVLTAGHCVSALEEMVFVRGYALGAEFPFVASDDVAGFSRVLDAKNGDIASESGDDFAIVELERKLTSPSALTLSAEPRAVNTGDPVVVIGTSEGLPMKIDDGGTVFDVSPQDYFEITSDTFEGGSGSPVFSRDGQLLGILVGGAVDYAWDGEEECFRRARYDAPEQRGEIIVRAEVLLEAWKRSLANDERNEEPACSSTPGRVGRGCPWVTAVLIGFGLVRRSRRRAHPLRRGDSSPGP